MSLHTMCISVFPIYILRLICEIFVIHEFYAQSNKKYVQTSQYVVKKISIK